MWFFWLILLLSLANGQIFTLDCHADGGCVDESPCAGSEQPELSTARFLNPPYSDTQGGSLLNLNGPFSISFWVKTNSARQILFRESDLAGSTMYQLSLGKDSGKLVFDVKYDNYTHLSKASGFVVADDTWHHVVWTDNMGAVEMYLDSEPDAADFSYVRPHSPWGISDQFIGAWRNQSNVRQKFVGLIANLQFWDSQLVYKQIDELSGVCSAGLVSSYGFETNKGMTPKADVTTEETSPCENSLQSMRLNGTVGHQLNSKSVPITQHPSWAISVWIKSKPYEKSRIYQETDGNGNDITIGSGSHNQDQASRIRLYLALNGKEGLWWTSTEPVFDDTWHQVVFSSNTGNIALYVDGVEDQLLFPGNTPIKFAGLGKSISAKAYLGGGPASPFRYVGYLDQLRFFDTSLSITQALQESRCGSSVVVSLDFDDKTLSNNVPWYSALASSVGSGDSNHRYTATTACRSHAALHLGNTSGFIRLNDQMLPLAPRNTPMTFAFWVRGPTVQQQYKPAFFSESSLTSDDIYSIYAGADGTLNVKIRAESAILVDDGFGAVVMDDTWHHVTVIDELGSITAYLDGDSMGAAIRYRRPQTWALSLSSVGGVVTSRGPCCQLEAVMDEVELHAEPWGPEDVYLASHCGVAKSNPLVAALMFEDDNLNDEASPSATHTVIGSAMNGIVLSPDTPCGESTASAAFGGSSTIILQDHSALPLVSNADSFTITAWIKPRPDDYTDAIFFSESGAIALYALGVDGKTGGIKLVVKDATGTVQVASHSEYNLRDNVWHHIAVVDVQGRVTIYVDGRELQEDVTMDYDRERLMEEHKWDFTQTAIGGIAPFQESAAWVGSLDEVQLFRTDLSLEEINSEYYCDFALHFGFDNTNDIDRDVYDRCDALEVGKGVVSSSDAPCQDTPRSAHFTGKGFWQLVFPTFLPLTTSAHQAGHSIAMWVKGKPQKSKGLFVESASTSDKPLYALLTDSRAGSSRIRFYVRHDNLKPLVNTRSAYAVLDDTWHHIALTDNHGSVVLYIDGKPDPMPFSYSYNGKWEMDLTHIGGRLRQTEHAMFDGYIDELQVMARVLAPDEVQVMHNCDSSLIAEFDFDNGLVTDTTTTATSTGMLQIQMDVACPSTAARSAGFDGSTYLTLTSPNLPVVSEDEFSVSFWLKTTDSAGTIYSETSSKDTVPLFTIGLSNGCLQILMRSYDSETTSGVSHTTVSDGNWHHVVASSSYGSFEVYIDGQSEYDRFDTFEEPLYDDKFDLITIGALQRETGPAFFFEGSLDDFRVYASAISKDMVLQEYECAARLSQVPKPAISAEPAIPAIPEPDNAITQQQGGVVLDRSRPGETGVAHTEEAVTPWLEHDSGSSDGEVTSVNAGLLEREVSSSSTPSEPEPYPTISVPMALFMLIPSFGCILVALLCVRRAFQTDHAGIVTIYLSDGKMVTYHDDGL